MVGKRDVARAVYSWRERLFWLRVILYTKGLMTTNVLTHGPRRSMTCTVMNFVDFMVFRVEFYVVRESKKV